jgi:hypothetical protein
MSERTKFLLSGPIIGIYSHSLASHLIDTVWVKRPFKGGYAYWQTIPSSSNPIGAKKGGDYFFKEVERVLKAYGGSL